MKHSPTALLAILALFFAGQCAFAQPTIFNYSQTANPGDVITIQGDSFGNAPHVWIQFVTGTETSLSPQFQLPVLSATGNVYASGSNSFVSTLIPNTESLGLYAIWISSDGGNTFSAPVYINQAVPWNADDLCGTVVDPNRQFHLYGRNLEFSGTGTPSVTFVSGSISLAATVTTGTDPYVLAVTAPSGLLGGTNYTLMVNNGLGGNYGTVAGPVLTGTITSGSDPFGIGVPWGADYASYPKRTYTVPYISATTNMTQAIQNGINAVSGSGGGVVALQSGTYQLSPGGGGNVNDFLTMRSNVVIQGAGMNSTVLLMSGTSTSDPLGYHFGLSDGGNTLYDCGLSNLTLWNTPTGGSSNLSFNHSNHDKFFAVNVYFRADVENNIYVSGSQAIFKNCVVFTGSGVPVVSGSTTVQDSGSPVNYSGVIDSVMQNNFFQYYAGRLWLSNGCQGMLILSNTMSRIAFPFVLGESGGLDVQQSQDTVVMDNLLQRDPTLSGTYNLVENNDGETIMNQTGHDNYPIQGQVTSASSLMLTDTSQDWTNNYAQPNDGQMYYLTIIKGVGSGQTREILSNTTTTLTIDSPWQVVPAVGSEYAVHHIESLRHLIKDNILQNVVQGLVYYSISMKDTVVVNNTLYNGGGIYLRSDYRPSPTNEFNIQKNLLVTGNAVTRTSANPYNWTDSYAYIVDWLVMTGSNHAPGTGSFMPEFRGNTVTAGQVPSQKSGLGGEGFALVATTNGGEPMTDGTTASAIGGLFQGNTAVTCTNAFHLCTGDYYATLWGNTLDNCGSLLYDGTAGGVSYGSVHTLDGPVPPTITQQPQNVTIIEGGTATFTAAASGIPGAGYEWDRAPAATGVWSYMTDISGTYSGTQTGTLTVTNATLAMNGDQFACVASNDYEPDAATNPATLTVQSGYAVWASPLFGSQYSNTAISNPTATPQNDGIPNALKYLCGINPAVPMSTSSYSALPVGGVTITGGTTYATITYRQNPSIPGVTVTVQSSTDLINWQTAAPASTQTIGTDPETGDPIIQISVQSGRTSLFLRLQVTLD